MLDRVWAWILIAACCVAGVGGWSGCAASRSGAAAIPAGEPMPTLALRYTFELMPGPPSAVRVTMSVLGTHAKSRLAIAPNWGGVENCERFVQGLSVRDGAGRVCAVRAMGHGWEVEHEPDEVLTATYELRAGDHDPLAKFGTHYEPIVRDDLFQMIGETGLVYPEWLENRGPVDVEFAWLGFRERGWTPVSSFDGTGDTAGPEMARTVHVPLEKFRHAMFMAGKLRVVDRDVKGGRLRVAVYGDDWQFKDEELADLVARIVASEREFARDFDDPYFLVTVSPTGERASARSVSMGGTGLTNCFALYLAPASALGPESPHRQEVLHLLAHEYFHTWNGGVIGMEDPPPEQLVYWFSEGFTDFYASRLLLRAGLIDEATWLARTNRTLQNLYLSPVATAPASLIEKEFWTRREVQELPYKRGEVVALCLDEEVRRVSGKSLDDFFLDVLREARQGEKVNTDRLLARIAKWTSPEFAAEMRRIVVDGRCPTRPGSWAFPQPCEDRETYRWDPGFDLDASLKTKVATGVRTGSAAYNAGLRDGQKIEGVSIYHGDPEKEITLVVRVEGEKKEIRYWPRGEPVKVVGYRPNVP